MRFCYNCSRLTPSTAEGQPPLFCGHCGRTYDTKYCPRLHPNFRSATVCSQCGSKELSTPQPKVPFWLGPLLWLLTLFPGAVLWAGTVVFAVWYGYMLIRHQELLLETMLVGLLVALLWAAYLQLPDIVRKAIGKRLAQRSGKDRARH